MPSRSEEIRLPNTYVIIGEGDPIEERNLMEFRLLYEGEVESTGNKSKPIEVHKIRRSFHQQLRRLWNTERNLQELAKHSYGGPYPATEQERFDRGLQAIGTNWSRAGYELIPVVTPKMALRCSIDILLLRPDEDRFIFERSDIDGQVKTLFDALRIPEDLGQTGGMGPQEDETPFFCLLQDDKLISEVRVTADKLLLLPSNKEVKSSDCFVVIHVKLNHRSARTFDNYFG